MKTPGSWAGSRSELFSQRYASGSGAGFVSKCHTLLLYFIGNLIRAAAFPMRSSSCGKVLAAKRTGAVARPSCRSAAAGLPACATHTQNHGMPIQNDLFGFCFRLPVLSFTQNERFEISSKWTLSGRSMSSEVSWYEYRPVVPDKFGC